MTARTARIELRPWANGDLPILQRTVGDARMMEHLGGPESTEQILRRHERYLEAGGRGGMFTIWSFDFSATAGNVGFWESDWQDTVVYETGWMVLPEFAGRGIATQAALEIVGRAREEAKHRYLHAFPSVSNAPSNAVCAKAGFANLGVCEWEFPKGQMMVSNDWVVDLLAVPDAKCSEIVRTE